MILPWEDLAAVYTLPAVCVFLCMTFLWIVQLRTRNAGIVDLGWVTSLALSCVLMVWMGHGDRLPKFPLLLMVMVWSGRLFVHLLRRFLKENCEDARYAEIRKKFEPRAGLKFFFIFQFQALTVLLLSIPFAAVSLDTNPAFSGFHGAGLLIWGIAVAGETLADNQLREFKKNPENRGKTCEAGFWKFSRHPNYFFEWMIWVAYAIYALPAPFGWLGITAPALMLHFLLNVSGVPPAEGQSLKSKGDCYRAYQKRTSVFFPWFPKKS